MRATLLLAVYSVAIAAPRSCPPVPGSEAILKPGAHVVLGEMHGTNEVPRLIADLACSALELGPLRVGLEIFTSEQPRLDEFLASAGTAENRRALLAGSFWTRDSQDGRSSIAMLALIESLRVLKHTGTDVRIVAIDADPKTDDGSQRDQAMAGVLAAAFARETRATFLVLVGNLHPRKAPHPSIKQTWMAQDLLAMKQKVTTLDMSLGGEGTAWVCMPECGPAVIGRRVALPRGITLAPTRDQAFDGTYSIGTSTFAQPAARDLTKEEKRRAELIPLELEANRAWIEGKFLRSADLKIELASRDPGRASAMLYDAACSLARGGDPSRAFTQLNAAINAGLKDRGLLERAKDLASLHGDPRWPQLLERLQSPK